LTGRAGEGILIGHGRDRYRLSDESVVLLAEWFTEPKTINATNMDAYAEDFALWESEFALEGAAA
jgi:hypothetical protein